MKSGCYARFMTDGHRSRMTRMLATALLVASSAMAQTATKGFAVLGQKSSDSQQDVSSVVKAKLFLSADAVAQGGDLPVAVQLTIEPGWHVWANETQARSLPDTAVFESAVFTSIALSSTNDSLQLLGTQWPLPQAIKADLGEGPQSYAVFEGSVTLYAKLGVAAAAAGTLNGSLTLSLQACTSTNCVAPQEINLPLSIQVRPGTNPRLHPEIFAGYDSHKLVNQPGPDANPDAGVDSGAIRFDIFGTDFTVDPRGAGLIVLLLVAFLGGGLLNFTPCVLPVIPLKIMALSAAAGDRKRCFRLGLCMSLGVLAFWLVLGGFVGGLSGFTEANQLFQYPAFTLALGAFIAVMAVGMAGTFALQLPQWVNSVEATHDSPRGSFVMGVMTAVLSTPCTAPLMGAAAGWAASSGSLATVLMVFGTIGAGMASPYLLLSAAPHLVRKMPRSGPASELVKQVMALLLLAAAAFFIGAGVNGWLDTPTRLHWWVVGGFGAAAGVWLLWRTFAITSSANRRIVFGGVGLVIATLSLGITSELAARSRIDWIAYSEQALATAKAEHKVIVLDFTAEWCLNCKALESAVLNRPLVAEAINDQGVAAIKVDITSRKSDGWNLLHTFNRVSIPLLVVQRPDGTVVLKSDAYTPDQVITAVNQALAK